MNKHNRQIDTHQLQESKERVVTYVMNEITKDSLFDYVKKFKYAFASSIAVAALALFAILSFGLTPNPQQQPNVINLDQVETEKFAEVSYLSGTLIATSFQLNNNNTNSMFLATLNETEFEQKFEEYHQYFYTLKVFLEPDYFKNNAEFVVSDKEEYSSKMIFTADDITYNLYLSIENEIVSGELYVNQNMYELTGVFEEEDDEFSLELHAERLNNYIDISYDSEFGSETESTYHIESLINGVSSEKEINISHEADEYKVQMENTDSSFELTYEEEDGEFIYKLVYQINDSEGEVFITESINTAGETVYHYDVTEDGQSKEYNRGRPSFEDEEDEEDEESENTSTPFDQRVKKIYL